MNDRAVELLFELGRTTVWLALAGGIAWTVLRISRTTSPEVHRLSWTLVLLAGWSFARLGVTVPWYDAPAVVTRHVPAPAVDVAAARTAPMADVEMMPALPFELEAAEARSVAPVKVYRAPPPKRFPWALAALGGWLLGMVAIVAAAAIGYTRFVRQLPTGDVATGQGSPGEGAVAQGAVSPELAAQGTDEWNRLLAEHGVSQPIPLRMTADLGPMLCRLPRGYVLLVPAVFWAELDVAGREAILRHELAHYLRGDVWKSLAVRLLALPHWFNPISWLAVRRFEEAAEWACDRVAIADSSATEYAKALVRLSEAATRPALYGTTAGGRTLAARIRRLLSTQREEDTTMKKTILIALGVCLAALPLVRVQLVAKEPPRERLIAQVANSRPKSSQPAPTRYSSERPAGPTVSPYLNLLNDDASSPDKPKAVVSEKDGKTTQEIVDGVVFEITDGHRRAVGVAPPPVAAPNDARENAAKKMVAEARKAYEANLKAYEAGNVTVEGVYNWSIRWMGAAKGDNFDRVKEMAAFEAHLERMQNLHNRVKALYEAGAQGGEVEKLAAVDFFIAEAERMKANLTARPAPAMISTGTAPVNARVSSDTTAGLPEPLSVQIAPPAAAPKSLSDRQRTLRYDGKTFSNWATILKTDLSPEKRTEAIRAISEFGANGQGKEAAELILGVMESYSVWTIAPTSEGLLKQGALKAFQKIPRGEALESLTEALKNGNANQRLFALWVLPNAMVEPKESAALYVEAMKDADAHVRSRARWLVAAFAHDSPELIPSLRASLANQDRNDVLAAIRIIAGTQAAQIAEGEPRAKILPTLELIPELVGFLSHADGEFRNRAAEALVHIGQPAEDALIQATQSKDAEVAKLAEQTLERIDSLEKTKAAGSR